MISFASIYRETLDKFLEYLINAKTNMSTNRKLQSLHTSRVAYRLICGHTINFFFLQMNEYYVIVRNFISNAISVVAAFLYYLTVCSSAE